MAFCQEEDVEMSKKRHKPEEFVAKLRQVDVLVSQGKPVAEAVAVDTARQIDPYQGPTGAARIMV
jgi:hypothetical protein